MPTTRWSVARQDVLVVLCCGAALVFGCARQEGVGAKPAAPPVTLKDTFERLRDWSSRHAYLAIRPYVDPVAADDVIDLLVATDELLAANAAVQAAIRTSCPGAPLQKFDISGLTNWLGLFARDVQFAGAEENGNTGLVEVQIAGRLPLERLRFEKHQGRWIYMPGPTSGDLPAAVRELAISLDRVRATLEGQDHTPAQIERDYRLRIGPKLRLVRSTAELPASSTATTMSPR